MLHTVSRTATVLLLAMLGAALTMFVLAEESEAEVASFYGYELAGSPTATGEPFEPMGYTAASMTLPLGSYVTVCYELGCITVRINDRGPASYLGRDLDLSLGAAQAIGLDYEGVGVVSVVYH